METFIITLIFVLSLYILGREVFPIVKLVDELPDNITATNNAFVIKIIKQDNFKAILAQEYYESKSKWSLCFITGILFDRVNTVRELELMGHAISIQYYPDPDTARKIHANNLKNYYPEFKDINLDVIYEMLSENDFLARKWVRDNNFKLTKLLDKLLLGG